MIWNSKITTLDGKEAGSVELSDAIFGLEPRTDLHPALRQLAARQAPARHAQGQGPRRDLAHRQEDVHAEGHRRRPSRLGARAAVPRRRPRLRSGRAQPRASICRRRCARSRSSMRCRPRPRTAASSCSTSATLKDAKTKALVAAVRQARPRQRADHRRRRDRRELRPRRAQHSEHRRAADPGHQRLRHPAARQAGADQGRGRCAGGALQMSTQRSAPLRRHPVAGDHRKGDDRVRAQQGRVQGRARRDQAADQGSGREAVRRQGEERQHARSARARSRRSRARIGQQSPTSRTRS